MAATETHAETSTRDVRPRRPPGAGGIAGPGRRLETALIIGAPALLALLLCLYEISSRSLWIDESASVAIASQHGSAFGTALAHDGGNMLGFYALLHVLIGLFGNGAVVIRAPAALAAAITVACVSALGLRLFDRRIALAAGVLCAISLSLVFWGQDARGYTPMIALITASFLALAVALERPPGDWRPWLAYGALLSASIYCGLEAVLVAPAQLLVLIWHRDRVRPLLLALAGAAICCLPLVALAASRGSTQLFWVPAPSLRVFWQVVQALTSAALQPNFGSSLSGALIVLTLLVLGLAAWRTWARLRARDPAAEGPALLLAWLLVPFALALIESLVGQSIFQARYLLVSLPAVALLLAWALAAPGTPRVLGLTVLAALIVLRAVPLASSYGSSPENWRAATAYIMARAQPRDCTAFYPQDGRMPFKYYLGAHTGAPAAVLPDAPWSVVRPYVEDYASLTHGRLAALPSSCARVWLVSAHEGAVGGPPTSRADHERYLRLEGNLRAAYPRVASRSFGYGGAVEVALYWR